MPLGALRKKSSAKDLNRRSKLPGFSSDAPPLPPTAPGLTTSTGKGANLLQLESTGNAHRPFSSHHPAPSQRPDLPRRKSSPRSSEQLLSIPRARQSLKYASEPDINAKYKAQARRSSSPPRESGDAAPAPTIGITAPSRDESETEKSSKRRTLRPFGHTLSFRSTSHNSAIPNSRMSDVGTQTQVQIWESRQSSSSIDRPAMPSQLDGTGPSPLRHSESSAAHRTTQNPFSVNGVSSKASSLFKFSRRKKNEPLFPLPVRVSPPSEPAKSVSIASSDSPTHTHSSTDYIPPVPPIPGNVASHSKNPSSELGRNGSAASAHSARSSPPITIAPPNHPHARSRSGTLNSTGDRAYTPHLQDSGRNSTASTTLGRNSIAGLRSLTSRLRHPSEALTPRHGSPGGTLAASANTSFALSRETLVVPEREEGESAGKYYARLERDMPKRNIATALSKSNEQFNKDALRSLLRTFKFYEEPMDMSLRKFLWEVSLPGEAQQIDRVIGAFAERYHECNPHIFHNLDQANFISYSLIILHSDLFNPNNKTKMQRHEYQRNVRDQGIPAEILGYFYDNIQYTEFIAQNADEDDGESKSKAASKKARRVKQKLAVPDANRNGKVDPYVVIIDDDLKLDTLKPILRDELGLDDTYSYMGTSSRFDVLSLRAAFTRFGTLQITSARSRPEAFATPLTTHNPQETMPGVVDIPVAKVGIVWRKSAKRKKTRSPWQEWGAILTKSQLYFFRNVSWVKNLCHQAEVHHKQGNSSVACVFRPPILSFVSEGKVSTDEAVALVDMSYRRHKYAFVLARRGTSSLGSGDLEQHFEETILAQDEADMNDWIHKINYASAFKTSNVRIHSWHPGCRAENILGPSTPTSEQDPIGEAESAPNEKILDAHEKEMSTAAQKAIVRTQMTKEKLATARDDLAPREKTLEELVRTARHLEILAPLNDKTRSDLLTFGARLSHNIRWFRYDVSRLRVHRDILFKEMQEDESTTSTYGMGMVDAGERFWALNGRPDHPNRAFKTDAVGAEGRRGPGHARLSKSDADEPPHGMYRNSDILDSIDEAFATPPETLTQIESSSVGNLRLFTLAQAQKTDPDSPDMQSASSFRPSSVSSTSSWPRGVTAGALTPTQAVPGEHEGRRPSTASGSEMGKNHVGNSPHSSSKSRARRSLQRTLREPREGLATSTSRAQRPKAGKEKENQATTDTDDNASTHGSEGLARRKGSFTVHGKKASIITIPEWERRPAEERLRLRKQVASESSRTRSYDGPTDDEGSVSMGHRASDAFSSSVAEESQAE